MSRPKTWAQCNFQKGNSFTQGWIDSRGAKVGNFVELLSLDGEFWEVIGVGNTVKVLPPYSFKNNI